MENRQWVVDAFETERLFSVPSILHRKRNLARMSRCDSVAQFPHDQISVARLGMAAVVGMARES